MEKKRLVVELTEEEEKEFNEKRGELIREKGVLHKIPISINEIDMNKWEEAFSIASPHDREILALFHFYEDGKDESRVN